MDFATINLEKFSSVTLRLKKDIQYFVLSVALFSIGNVVFFTISPTVAQLIQTVALVIFLQKLFTLINWNFESSYFKFFFILLIAWSVVVVFKGFDTSYLSIKQYVYTDFIFWPLIIPFTALLPKNGVVFKQIFSVFFYLGIGFLFFAVLAAKLYFNEPSIAEQGVWAFTSGSGFVLLTWKYHTNFRRLVALGAIVLSLLIVTLLARRNIIITDIDFLFFSFLMYFTYYSKGSIQKKLASFLIFSLMICSAFYVFQQHSGTDFKLITGRASEDTRQDVLTYYFNGIKGNELMGKGMDGTYICPVFNKETNDNQLIERDVIECGYLQIVLSGGLIQLGLFLLITIPAIFLGIFYSNNGLSKACGVIIFLWLIDMIPYGLPTISVRYMLVWFCVGVCYSKSFRRLSESEIVMSKVNKLGKVI